VLRWLVSGSVRFRLLVIPLAAVLTAVGAASLKDTKVDVLPELGPPTVVIQTESLGLSASEVEALITVPEENFLLSGIKGVETLHSDSIPGLSRIELIFPRGTNMLDARALVQEQLTRTAQLPNVAAPPQMLQPVSSTGRVMMIGLTSKTVPLIDLSILARWTIVPRLLGVAGVANVAVWGERDRQIQVQVDPRRLAKDHLTLDQIVATAGNAQLVSPLSYLHASTPGAGGFIDGPNQRLSIRHELPLGKPENLAQVPVDGTHGVRLGSVSSVVQGHQPLIGDAIVDGHTGLLLAVDKRPGTSTPAVTQAVKNALGELQPGLRGIHVDPRVFQPASFIHSAINDLTALLIVALALVLLALAAFFLEWRSVLISVLTIPLSLLAATWVLDALGYTLNALVVAGLLMSIGVVTDQAIAATNEIARTVRARREAGSRSSTSTVVLDALAATRVPIGYATLIVLVTVTPLVIAQGLGPTFVHPLALAYGLAVLASMVVTLTLTPALGVLLFERPPRRRVGAQLGARLRSAYAALVSRTMRLPARLLVVLGVLGLAGLAVVPFLEEPDHPTFRDRDVLVRTLATPSTSLPEMDRISRRTAAALRSLPGIDGVAVAVGRAVGSDRPVGTNTTDTWVRIAGGADYEKTLAGIRSVVGGTPGIHSTVTTYEDDRSAGVLEGPSSAVDVRVYGHDYGVLRQGAAKVAAVMGGIPGVRDPRLVGLPTEQPTLDVRVNLAAALRHGIKPGDVRRALATLTSGLTVGNFFEAQKVFEVVVRGVPAASRSADSVRGLLIDSPAGGTVPLRDIASIRVAASPTDIRHDATKRYLDVQADAQGRDVGSIRTDIEHRLRGLAFPLEYHAELVSASATGAPTAAAESGTPHGQFVVFLIAAEIAIILLLQAAFGNWRLAFVVCLTVPLATAGGLIAALVAGTLNELGAMAGLLAIIGLTFRPAIALITRIQAAQRRPGAVPGPELTMQVALDQFAPTAMAAVATALALLPFALAPGAAGNEITQPMAVVMLGGLVTAMVVNLLVVPAISLAFGAAIPMGSAPIEPEADGQPGKPASAPHASIGA
jgi:Cu/Ag efflux pump CusA